MIVTNRIGLLPCLVLAAMMLCGGATAAEPSGDEAIVQTMDRYLSIRAEMGQFNGVVLFARGDRPIYRKGFGYADIDKKTPYRPEFVQPVASLTKMFTAFVALSLQADGKLNLQAPLCKYFMPCPDAWRPVTLWHLVHHSSGIPDYEEKLGIGSPAYMEYMRGSDATGRILADAINAKLEFPPGSKFNYSNSGYVVLGTVLEKVGKAPLSELVKHYALEPAGMKSSGMFVAGERPATLAPGYTHDVLGWDKVVAGYPITSGHVRKVAELPLTGPAGDAGLYSNADDLLRWSVALGEGGLLSTDMQKTMFDGGADGYGFGWFVGKAFDRTRHRHTGNLPGYLADFVRFPEDKITLIVLSNVDRSLVSRIVRDVSAIILGKPFDMPVRGAMIPLSKVEVQALEGEYQTKDGGRILISNGPEYLTATWKGRFTAILIPLSPTSFYLPLADGRALFTLDEAGKAATVNLRYSGEDNSAARVK